MFSHLLTNTRVGSAEQAKVDLGAIRATPKSTDALRKAQTFVIETPELSQLEFVERGPSSKERAQLLVTRSALFEQRFVIESREVLGELVHCSSEIPARVLLRNAGPCFLEPAEGHDTGIQTRGTTPRARSSTNLEKLEAGS